MEDIREILLAFVYFHRVRVVKRKNLLDAYGRPVSRGCALLVHLPLFFLSRTKRARVSEGRCVLRHRKAKYPVPFVDSAVY